MDAVRELSLQLYDTTTRPGLVAKGLVSIGAEKLLNTKQIELVASLCTVSGLMAKTSELQVIALPYVAKARNADGRAELAVTVRAAAAPYVQMGVDKANEKLLAPTRELAAPYIERILSSRDAIAADARYKRAVEGLEHVRRRPLEVAKELRGKAVDLIKYEDLSAYREYVQSQEFQADTVKLIREDLPAVARDAARKGLELLHRKAAALAEELHSKRAALAEAWQRGYEIGRCFELDDLRERAARLADELQVQINSRVGALKDGDYKLQEVVNRIARIFRLDNLFARAPTDAPAAAAAN